MLFAFVASRMSHLWGAVCTAFAVFLVRHGSCGGGAEGQCGISPYVIRHLVLYWCCCLVPRASTPRSKPPSNSGESDTRAENSYLMSRTPAPAACLVVAGPARQQPTAWPVLMKQSLWYVTILVYNPALEERLLLKMPGVERRAHFLVVVVCRYFSSHRQVGVVPWQACLSGSGHRVECVSWALTAHLALFGMIRMNAGL
jgi:hypothetical protein